MNRYLDHFTQWLGDREITPAVLRAFKIHLCSMKGRTGKPAAPATAKRYLDALKPHLRDLRLDGKHGISDDDLKHILKAPRIPAPPPPVALLPEEIRALLVAAKEFPDKSYAWFTLLALTTGVRPGSVLGIQWDKFSLAEGTLSIYAGKTNSWHKIPLKWSATLTRMAQEASTRRGLVFVINGPRGMPRTGKRGAWTELMASAGLPPYMPKTLRRAVATAVAGSGHLSMVEYSRWLGHSTLIADKHYWDGNMAPKQGATVEAWLNCETEFAALLGRCLEA